MATVVQQSKRTNKRQILGGVTGNTKPPVLKGSSTADLVHLLDKLKIQLESKIDTLQEDGTNEKNKLKDIFSAAMVKINKTVKTMRVGEFNALYKCDLLSVIENLPEPAAGKKRDRLQTPSQQTTAKGRVPLETPSRTVRKGETLFSKNGTPIEAPDEASIIATVTKAKKRRTGSTGDSTGAALDINLGGGQFISLQDPQNINSLNGSEKNMALQQLQMLRDQVDFYLKKMEAD